MARLKLTDSRKFLDTPLGKEALKYSRKKHSGKVSLTSTRPHISHCIEVARILHKNGYSESVIVSALLHDTATDSNDLEEIEEKFGEEVSNIVEYLIEDPDPTLSWTERKLKYIQSVTNAPEGAVAVSLADNLHTSSEILQTWFRIRDSAFLGLETTKENYKWYYRSLSEMYFLRSLFFENQSLLNLTQQFTKVISNMGM